MQVQNNHAQFTNPSFLQKLALDLIKPRKSNYPEDSIYYYLHQNKFVLEDIPELKNKFNHTLKATLVKHRVSLLQKIQQDFNKNHKLHNYSQEKCIIYLHGLGSNRMEGLSILPHLPKGYALFTFDLSGSGKSQGQFTSYGYRQQQDIQAVLNYLHQNKHYKNFIIWGRSMGAVSSLLFNNKINQNKFIENQQTENLASQQSTTQTNQKTSLLNNLSKYVKCIIADSPFCSFESISKDIALNKMSVPHFFTQIALKFIQSTFQKILEDKKTNMNFTPFQIDFTKNKLKPVVPIVFVYSLNDEIVSCQHSQKIIKSIQKIKEKMVEKIIIPECSHNSKRPQIVIESIFQKIEKFCNIKNQKNIISNQSKTKKVISDSYFHTQTGTFQKQTKIIRRKSFWNFQQEFGQIEEKGPTQQNQTIFHQRLVSKNNVDEKLVNEKPTVRRNIFDRNESKTIINNRDTTISKKRGLSLSSTIQRTQSMYKQNNPLKKTSIQLNNSINQKILMNETKKGNKIRQMSVDIKPHQKNKDQSHRKSIDRHNRDVNSQTLLDKTMDSRCSQARNFSRNRISLGGSKQFLRSNSRDMIERNSKPKNFKKLGNNNNTSLIDETDCKRSSKYLEFSRVSQYDLYSSKSFMDEIPSKDTSMSIINPNVSHQLRSLKSIKQNNWTSNRQSVKTIDLGVMTNSVDPNLTAFINNKLQYQFDNFDVINRVFSKTTNNQDSSFIKIRSRQTNLINENENDQKFLSELRANKDLSSTINVPSHSSFRPSIRLYNEKRKKKLQTQHAIFNKISENIEITNQRYLVED